MATSSTSVVSGAAGLARNLRRVDVPHHGRYESRGFLVPGLGQLAGPFASPTDPEYHRDALAVGAVARILADDLLTLLTVFTRHPTTPVAVLQ